MSQITAVAKSRSAVPAIMELMRSKEDEERTRERRSEMAKGRRKTMRDEGTEMKEGRIVTATAAMEGKMVVTMAVIMVEDGALQQLP